MDQQKDPQAPGEGPERRSDEANWAKPVRTLQTKDVPAGAIDLNVTGRRVSGATTGFGKLWQKSFWVRLEGAAVTPQPGKKPPQIHTDEAETADGTEN